MTIDFNYSICVFSPKAINDVVEWEKKLSSNIIYKEIKLSSGIRYYIINMSEPSNNKMEILIAIPKKIILEKNNINFIYSFKEKIKKIFGSHNIVINSEIKFLWFGDFVNLEVAKILKSFIEIEILK
jgi:hypothetical protein